jgi:hypothetical protein
VYFGAVTRRGKVFKAAAGKGGALFHAQQTEACAADSFFAEFGHIKTDAVVFDGQMKMAIFSPEFNGNFAGARMADYIGESFLGDTEAFRLDDWVDAVFQRIGAKTGM